MQQPPSRRERPAKPALSRTGIIAAALELLRTEGLERVTMRRIAAALDTGPASLYVYVRDTADLHAQVLDALLPATAALPIGGPWRERVKALLRAYGEVLFAHPALARLAMTTMPSGPHYLGLVDRLLGALGEGGVADPTAAWAVDLLLLHMTAQAAEKGAWADADHIEEERLAQMAAVRGADPALHPHVARIGAELHSGGPGRIDWQIDLLLNGILSTPRPAETLS